MEDLITLICPSCGGALQVSSNTSTLKCQHCGVEHLVRRNAEGISLESFARCPKCGRNDRVEKVSAIIKSQRQEQISSEQKTGYYLDESGNRISITYDAPIKQTQYTSLAQILLPPSRPIRPPVNFSTQPTGKIKIGKFFLKLSSIFVLIISLISFILTIGFIIDLFVPAIVCFGILGVSSLVGGIILMRLAKTTEERHKEKLLNSEEYEVTQNKIEREYHQAKQKWEHATKRWESLYYCHRDDCVFALGDFSYAPIEEVKSYLYKD